MDRANSVTHDSGVTAVFRLDRSEISTLAPPKRRPDGYVEFQGRLTRTGVLSYVKPDGSIQRELRHPDDVFHADSVASLQLVPVTHKHPSGLQRLDSKTARAHQRGATGQDVRQDGQWLAGTVAIHDAEAVAAVEAGRAEVSAGYGCRLDCTPGTYEGQAYDVRQRDIRYNHLAVDVVARAGGSALRLDDAGNQITEPGNARQDGRTTMKRMIGGKEIEVSEEVAARLDAVDAEIASAKAREQAAADALAARTRELATARTDSATALADATEKARKAFDAQVSEAVAVTGKARAILGPDAKLDGLTPLDVKRLVLAKRTPDVKLDGKSDEYVNAAFDIASRNDAAAEMAPVIRTATGGGADKRGTGTESRIDSEDVVDARTLREFVEQERRAQLNAWRKPVDNRAA